MFPLSQQSLYILQHHDVEKPDRLINDRLINDRVKVDFKASCGSTNFCQRVRVLSVESELIGARREPARLDKSSVTDERRRTVDADL